MVLHALYACFSPLILFMYNLILLDTFHMCKGQLVLTVSVQFPAAVLFVVRKLTVGMKTTELQYKPQKPAGDA